jgi:hypothetical protein
MIELTKSHLFYENESFAFEVNKDELFFGNSKIWKTKGHEYAIAAQSGRSSFKVIEGTRTINLSWLIRRSDYLIHSVNKFLMECEQHGLKEYFYNNQFEAVSPPEKSRPKVLTMNVLSAGFIIWLASVLVACVIFIIELIVFYIKRRFSRQ